jgi:hypothetical protein
MALARTYDEKGFRIVDGRFACRIHGDIDSQAAWSLAVAAWDVFERTNRVQHVAAPPATIPPKQVR